MATTDSAASHHSLVLPLLIRSMYGHLLDSSGYALVQEMVKDGTLQTDRLYEHYEAKRFGCEVESVYGHDLSDGKEVKLRTLIECTRANGPTTYEAKLLGS